MQACLQRATELCCLTLNPSLLSSTRLQMIINDQHSMHAWRQKAKRWVCGPKLPDEDTSVLRELDFVRFRTCSLSNLNGSSPRASELPLCPCAIIKAENVHSDVRTG